MDSDLWGILKDAQDISVPYIWLSKLFLLAITIAEITIGAVYLKDCPLQHNIPVYVLVFGVLSAVTILFICMPCDAMNFLCVVWMGLLSLFMFCWTITGSVWIYSIYPPNYNSTVPGEPYCNKTLYLFAFWTTTQGYIMSGFFFLIICCRAVCSMCNE
ncbi:hypothetical protein AMEX_G11220 [Astyanax mexicanus]|uniref:Uncharacterized protein n=1 Tax=Astyanax mexicanus TaxID=7994 RepID=A0A8T2LZW3_ASTMX|nr:hypothetical protein AMEX_G11220 [Astyanax mexicanus]